MISLRKASKENLNFAWRDKGLAFQFPSMYYFAILVAGLWLCKLYRAGTRMRGGWNVARFWLAPVITCLDAQLQSHRRPRAEFPQQQNGSGCFYNLPSSLHDLCRYHVCLVMIATSLVAHPACRPSPVHLK